MQTTTETTKKTKGKPPKLKTAVKKAAKKVAKDTKSKTKTKTKTETTTKALAIVPPTVPVTAAARKEAEKRIGSARECLLQMHKNWFLFAKHLKSIRDENDAEKFKVESFNKLCQREFPTVDQAAISKMINVVEKMGPEIERRMKSPTYLVPSSDACYYLTTLKRVNPDGTVHYKVAESEYEKLQKELLDSGAGSPTKSERMGYVTFKKRIQELIGKAKSKLREEINAETEKYVEEEQRKLDKELRDNGIHDEEEMLDEDDFESEVEEVDFEDVDEDVTEHVAAASVEALAMRVDFLIENVPPFVEGLSTIDGKTRDLLKRIKKLQTILTETIEALSGN